MVRISLDEIGGIVSLLCGSECSESLKGEGGEKTIKGKACAMNGEGSYDESWYSATRGGSNEDVGINVVS